VRQLEQVFGIELIARNGQQISLTQAGEAVLKFAEHFEDLMSETQTVISHRAGAVARPLSIAAPPTVATYTLPRLLAEFRAGLPEAKVTVSVVSLDQAKEQVLSGDGDVAVISAAQISDELAVEPLELAQLWLIAPADHPLANSCILSATAITDYPFLISGPGMESHRQVKLWAATHGARLRFVMEAHSHDALIQDVKSGLGLAFAGGPVIQNEVAAGRLAVLSLPETPIEFHLYLAHRADVHSPEKSRLLACVRSPRWRLQITPSAIGVSDASSLAATDKTR
jgi:DNA-binding transcriptional LysR family regulator